MAKLVDNLRDGIRKAAGFRVTDNEGRDSTVYAEFISATGAPSGRYGRDTTASLIYLRDDATGVADAIYFLAPSASTWRTLTSDLILPTASELTIATGAITVTQSLHTIDTEADAASDDLDTINGMADGEVVFFYPADGARTVVFKHGADNIVCPGARDISLDDSTDYVVAIANATDVAVFSAPQLWADLASTATGVGASMVGAEDAGGYYTGTTVEAELQEVGLFAKRLTPNSVFRFFDDFNEYQTGFTEADHPWILNSGTDAEAVDPAIVAAERGVIRLTSGDSDTNMAADGSQMVYAVPLQADSGALLAEARIKINTAITGTVVAFGLTDSTSLEMPATIGGSDVITLVADDMACLVYDSAADTDEWFGIAADGTVQDAGNATTGVAPTADTYQRLTISVSADGATIAFGIDGSTVLTLSGDVGVSPDVNLYLTVAVDANAAASEVVDVDYLYVSHDR